MKISTLFGPIIAIILCMAGCASPVKVTRVAAVGDKGSGVYYNLPKTLMRFEIPVTNTIVTPGVFSNYAVAYGFADKDTTIKTTTYSIGVPTISALPKRDPSNLFHVRIQGHYLEDRTLALEMDESGFLTSASAEADNRIIDHTVQTLETGAGIVGKLAAFGGAKAPVDNAELDARARDAADKIKTIQRERYELLVLKARNGASITGDALRISLDELAKSEQVLLSEFTGKVKKQVWSALFEFDPEDLAFSGNEKKTKELFRWNSSNGLSFISAPIGRAPDGFTNIINSGVTSSVVVCPQVMVNTNRVVVGEKSGFFYRRPNPTVFEFMNGDNLVERKEYPIPQLGSVLSLPSSTRSKSSKQQITLHRDTGALKSVVIGSKSWDPAQVAKVGNAVTSVITGQDELASLERTRKILEERKKIKDLNDSLSND